MAYVTSGSGRPAQNRRSRRLFASTNTELDAMAEGRETAPAGGAS